MKILQARGKHHCSEPAHTPVAAASVQHKLSQQKHIVQRAAQSQTAGVHSIPWPLEVSLNTKLELIRTSIPWPVEVVQDELSRNQRITATTANEYLLVK